MNMSYNEVLNRFKEERLNQQITQRAMSYILKMAQSHYSKAENGKKRFSFYEMQNLCGSVLDVYYIYTGRHCTDRFDEIFEDTDFEQLLSCLKIINMVAQGRRKEAAHGVNWNQLYSCTKYIEYADNEIAQEKNIFKATRVYKGLTQHEMAQHIGMDVKKLRELECGKLLPDSELIFEMYKNFGASPSIFLRDKKCMQSEITWLLNVSDDEIREKLIDLIKYVLLC